MKIGIVNGNRKLNLNIKDETLHIKLIETDTDEIFDILILNKRVDFDAKKLLDLGSKKTLVLINCDEYESFGAFKNILLITYGMNNKSCVTLSSISHNKIQLCIQRNLLALNNKIVEEQEICIDIPNGEKFLDEVIFFAAANILIYGDANNLSRWF